MKIHNDFAGNVVPLYEGYRNQILPNAVPDATVDFYLYLGQGSWTDNKTSLFANPAGTTVVYAMFSFNGSYSVKTSLWNGTVTNRGGNSFNERVLDEFINYSESTIDGLTYTVTGLGAALSGGFRNMKLDWKYNGAAHMGEGRWFPGKHAQAYAYGFSFENRFVREAIDQNNVSWSNGKRLMNGTLGILLFPMEFSKTGFKALDFLIDQAITGGIGYGVGKGLDKIPNY